MKFEVASTCLEEILLPCGQNSKAGSNKAEQRQWQPQIGGDAKLLEDKSSSVTGVTRQKAEAPLRKTGISNPMVYPQFPI